jgi:hypothetical protein
MTTRSLNRVFKDIKTDRAGPGVVSNRTGQKQVIRTVPVFRLSRDAYFFFDFFFPRDLHRFVYLTPDVVFSDLFKENVV